MYVHRCTFSTCHPPTQNVQGDVAEAAQMLEAVAECKEWLQHAPKTTAAPTTGAAMAAGAGARARLQQSKIKPPAGAVGGVTGVGGGVGGPLALRRRSSCADGTSLSVSSKARAAARATGVGDGGASLLGAKMREAEAACALGLDLADPKVVAGLRALREVGFDVAVGVCVSALHINMLANTLLHPYTIIKPQPKHDATTIADDESPVRAVLRRTLLLLLAAFALGGAVAGGAVAAWGGKHQHSGHRGLAVEPSSSSFSSPLPPAAVEWVGVERTGQGQGKREREREQTAEEEALLLVARTVVPLPIWVVGEEVEEDDGVVRRPVVVVP